MFFLNDTTLNCKHIAKATQSKAATKALPNSLQSQYTKREKLFYKNLPTLKKNKNPRPG